MCCLDVNMTKGDFDAEEIPELDETNEGMKLYDVTGFSEEQRKALVQKYGNIAFHWEDVKSWDHCVTAEEKGLTEFLIGRATQEDICPYMKTKGEHFHYCGAFADRLEREGILSKDQEIPTPNSLEYNSKIDHFSLQLYCLAGEERRNKCMEFNLGKRFKNSSKD